LFLRGQLIPGKRPLVLKGQKKLAPSVTKRRNKRILAQDISERAQTTPIAPRLDEPLNIAE
jgi:hypothetical protein